MWITLDKGDSYFISIIHFTTFIPIRFFGIFIGFSFDLGAIVDVEAKVASNCKILGDNSTK